VEYDPAAALSGRANASLLPLFSAEGQRSPRRNEATRDRFRGTKAITRLAVAELADAAIGWSPMRSRAKLRRTLCCTSPLG
jgi:hypothetical protein